LRVFRASAPFFFDDDDDEIQQQQQQQRQQQQQHARTHKTMKPFESLLTPRALREDTKRRVEESNRKYANASESSAKNLRSSHHHHRVSGEAEAFAKRIKRECDAILKRLKRSSA